MYSNLIALHSVVRWFVLISLIYAIYRAYTGWKKKKPFTKFDNTLRHTTATIAHIQLLLGMWLYFISPLVNYFFKNFKEAIHEREIRFFGMEHSSMMFLAVVLITIGSALTKRKESDSEKFRTMTFWYGIALLVILSSVPWPFSPLTARPYLRF